MSDVTKTRWMESENLRLAADIACIASTQRAACVAPLFVDTSSLYALAFQAARLTVDRREAMRLRRAQPSNT